MAVLLSILSVIGKVLLGILLFILFLVLFILLTPITYRMRIRHGEDTKAEAVLTWLLRILHVRVDFVMEEEGSDLTYKLRIFGIPVKKGSIGGDEEEGKAEKDSSEAQAEEVRPGDASKEADSSETNVLGDDAFVDEDLPTGTAETGPDSESEESMSAAEQALQASFGGQGTADEAGTSDAAEAAEGSGETDRKQDSETGKKKTKKEKKEKKKKKEAEELPNASGEHSGRNPDGSAKKKPLVEPGQWKYMPDESTAERAKELESELVELKRPTPAMKALAHYGALVGKVKKALRKAIAAYRKFRKKADPWIEYIRTDTFRRLRKRLFCMLGRIIHHLLPKKVTGYIRFGFEDPALTGELLGYVYAVNMIMPKAWKVHTEAEFEEPVIEGDVVIKGRIFIIYLVVQILKLLLNLDFFRLIRLVLRERKKAKMEAAEETKNKTKEQ